MYEKQGPQWNKKNPEMVSHTMLLLDADEYFKSNHRKLKNCSGTFDYKFCRNCGITLNGDGTL